MNEYRVTKYNPEFRNSAGTYTKNEWIMFTQIRQSFDGIILTSQEYQRVEDAYVEAALAFIREAGVASLEVRELQNSRRRELDFGEGSQVPVDALPLIIRGNLRNEYCCKLVCESAFVHFGRDYYMYLGVLHQCPKAEALATKLGLYVEELESPYHESPESPLSLESKLRRPL